MIRTCSTLVAALGLSLGLGDIASAQTISGQVLDAQLQPVPGVNLNAVDLLTGQDVLLLNDGTDINGQFLTTVPGPSLYRITFLPPPPPLAVLLPAVMDDVIVITSTTLGTVQLQPGVQVAASLADAGGLPVAGVDIDVKDQTTGAKVLLVGDTSNAFGNFSVVVPAGPITLQLDTRPVFTATLAPFAIDLSLTTDTHLGILTLEPGFHLSGQVVGPGGQPTAAADTDTRDAVTKAKRYTPGDNTDGNGNFDVLVPTGTWIVEACPPAGAMLVGVEAPPVPVVADTSVGVLTLGPGQPLSGTVTDAMGVPLAGVDVDVNIAALGTPVVLCGDNTDAQGHYSVIAPWGPITVTFDPPFSEPYAQSVHAGISILGPTIVDGVLPDCPGGVPYGQGLPGTGGIVPQLITGGGAPRLGNSSFVLALAQGRGAATWALLIGIAPTSLPFHQGTLLVDMSLTHWVLPLPLLGPPGKAGAGFLVIPAGVPAVPALAGLAWYGQGFVLDPGSVGTFAMTPGLQVTYCP